MFTQMETAGLLPRMFNFTKVLMTQTYKGHVTIAPRVMLQDYKNIFKNLTPEDYREGLEISLRSSFRKISLIRAVFGIEHEFDRYYLRLKQLLKDHPSKVLIDYHIVDQLERYPFK
mmetsp:Transcript_13789/g.9937  ORF Transcript_13789/g.9937 Transcript_13789/m.9937 type:complete len:116 (+) Transcript_13789:1275-1622(+)